MNVVAGAGCPPTGSQVRAVAKALWCVGDLQPAQIGCRLYLQPAQMLRRTQ